MADSDDEVVFEYVMPDLEHAVQFGTRKEVLQALATIAAHELSGNRCPKCQMSVMKLGEISSLMLRLQKIYEELDSISPNKPGREKSTEGKGSIRDIRSAASLALASNGDSVAPDSGVSERGTKAAPRRRHEGGNKPRR